ncbi:type 1 glutamine amidotransferase domain-containing protein [Enterobacter hormaechei]|uniref:type 1 glutamine amidotransferase domain-containing protein n=1 Tax=Enterobacter hormaechei TaxID=158836 RepID=UPI00375404A1
MIRSILHVVTNVSHYDDPEHKTGLWLSELTHAYDIFAAHGFKQIIVSPAGGQSPLEPRSLKWPFLDNSARNWLGDPSRMELLENTLSPEQIDSYEYDAIYFTGGHAVMGDFPENVRLQQITRDIHEQRGIVSSVCHGYCGLLNTRLSDGELLVKSRRITGFSWTEEILAGVSREMPYNAQQEMKQRGARYEKALLPFTPNVVVDGRLITGQNPFSAKLTAMRVVSLLDY